MLQEVSLIRKIQSRKGILEPIRGKFNLNKAETKNFPQFSGKVEHWVRVKREMKNRCDLDGCSRALFGGEQIIKFGYQVPRNLRDAYNLGTKDGNNKWAEAIRVEVNKLKEYDVFQAMAEGVGAPEGYSRIPLHWVFNVKHDFRHQARIVAGGHIAPIPDESPPSSVVTSKGVRLLLLVKAR